MATLLPPDDDAPPESLKSKPLSPIPGIGNEMQASRKLEAMAQLAGGIAHDFNNVLIGISGTAEALKHTLSEDDQRHEEIDDILHACNQAFGMTRQLLSVARPQTFHPEVIDLSRMLRGMMQGLRRLVGEDIVIHQDFSDVGFIRVDPDSLEQIVVNFALNAREAMPKGGSLHFKTSNAEIKPTSSSFSQTKAGSYVLLEVSDTGTGMPPEMMERLFEPILNTTEQSQGTSLGLAIVYGLLKQMDGEIIVKNETGQGSVFELYFPIHQASLQPEPVESHPSSPHGHETILVVEDEDLVRRIVVKKLRQLGYSVLEAKEGKGATELFRSRAASIDLVITDVVMPGINGQEMANQIRKVKPETRVLYMSGYPEDVISHHGIIDPDIDFLEKPKVLVEMASKVRQILDRPEMTERRRSVRHPSKSLKTLD